MDRSGGDFSPINSGLPVQQRVPLMRTRIQRAMVAQQHHDTNFHQTTHALAHIQTLIAESLDEVLLPDQEQPPRITLPNADEEESELVQLPPQDNELAAQVSGVIDEIVNSARRRRRSKEQADAKDGARFALLIMKSTGNYTYEHCTRLVDLALQLARELGYEDDQLYQEVEYGVTYKDIGEVAFFLTKQDPKQRQALSAYLAGLNLAQDALLHDIGKLLIPSDILMKPGPLTQQEVMIMRRHPEWGHQIISGIPEMHHAIPVVRHHHEKWDGKGYPDRLAGESIPLAARIVAVVDAFDAMTAERPYRKPMSRAEAGLEIQACSGTHFDPRVAQVFARMVARGFA